MSDISKNDVIGFANNILAMEKRIKEVERVNAMMEQISLGVKRSIEKLQLKIAELGREVEELSKLTFPPGQIDGIDHVTVLRPTFYDTDGKVIKE